MSERPKVPQEAWTAGMEAIARDPRDAAENARTWPVVYHVLHALGYDVGWVTQEERDPEVRDE